MKAEEYKKELIAFLKNDGYKDVKEDNDMIIISHPVRQNNNYVGELISFVEVYDLNCDLAETVEIEVSMLTDYTLKKTDKELICLRDNIANNFGVSFIKHEKNTYIFKMRNICCDLNSAKASVCRAIDSIFETIKFLGGQVKRVK